MKWSQFFTSAVGKKFVMSLTGLFLISFLIVHVGLNACIWASDNGEMFNKSADFMATMVVIRIMEYGLFLGFILHIYQGYVLEAKNLSRRGKGYAVNPANKTSRWYSRTMGLLGTLIFLFLIVHLSDFWIHSRFGGRGNIEPLAEVDYNGRTYLNLYARMREVFQNPLIV